MVGDLDIPYLILFSFKLLEANGQDEIRRCIDLVTRDRIWSLSNHEKLFGLLYFYQSKGALPHLKFGFNLYEL